MSAGVRQAVAAWRREVSVGAVSQFENFCSPAGVTRVNPAENRVSGQNNRPCSSVQARLFIRCECAVPTGDSTMQTHPAHRDKCTGCLQCEMACSFENYGTFATAKSRIKVFDFHHTGKKVPTPAPSATRPGVCTPAGGSHQTVDKAHGAKVVEQTTCVGCRSAPRCSPVWHGQLRAGNRQGAEVRPLRWRARLRRCLPTGAITFIDANWTFGQDATVGQQAGQSGIRCLSVPLSQSTGRRNMSWAGKILRVGI